MSGDLIPVATITGKIHLIRDMKVLLDRDLADRKRSQGTTSCGDRFGSRTKVRIAVPLAATCGTLWPLIPWLFDLLGHTP